MYQGKYEKRPDAPAKSAPHAAEAPAKETVMPEIAPESAAPVFPTRRQPARKNKANSKRGTLMFYSAYAAFILIFLIVIACLMQPLNDWLIKYESSQPNYARDQVFDRLFADPQWAELYELAGIKGNDFEKAADYAAYMERLVGNSELTCLETSAGLSGDRKYIIKLGSDKIASFTLVNKAAGEEIAQWELGKVELNVVANKSVLIGRVPGQKVYINGIEVNDAHIVGSVHTIAEGYLPEGIHGYRMEYLRVENLMTNPVVTAVNPDGSKVSLIHDAENSSYTAQVSAQDDMSEDEKLLAMNATQAYAKYMIGKASLWNVQQYYETSSQFYKTISSSEVGWAQNAASFDFTDPTFTEFYRYSDELFSVRIDMSLLQTRFDGSVKENSLNNTLFFRKNAAGKWMIMEATNVAVQERVSQVRITFMNGDEVLQNSMIDADAAYMDLPQVTAPEGMVFAGWATEETDDNGNTTLTILYGAADGNRVYLSTDTLLEPMTLHAYFEEAKQ